MHCKDHGSGMAHELECMDESLQGCMRAPVLGWEGVDKGLGGTVSSYIKFQAHIDHS